MNLYLLQTEKKAFERKEYIKKEDIGNSIPQRGRQGDQYRTCRG
jgi:hypothetical protein